jgi:hypothetical protein
MDDAVDDGREDDWLRRKEELETALLNAAAVYLLRLQADDFCIEHWMGSRRILILCGLVDDLPDVIDDPELILATPIVPPRRCAKRPRPSSSSRRLPPSDLTVTALSSSLATLTRWAT